MSESQLEIGGKAKLKQQVQERTKELQESQDLLQTVFDVSSVATAVFEPVKDQYGKISDFKILRVNKKIKSLYKRDDLLGLKFGEISDNAYSLGIIEALISTFETGEILDKEICHQTNDQESWYRIQATPHENLLIFSLENVTSRKKEALILKENILFKQHITQTSPDVILILNIEKNFLRYSNRDLSEFFQNENGQVKPKAMDFLGFIHPRDQDRAMDFHKKLIKASDDDVISWELRIKLNEEWAWYNVRGKIFQRRDNGYVTEYMLLLQNVNEQKKIQRALVDAEKLSIKGEIARTLAHELRNPLASISLAADVLRKKLKEHNTPLVENYLNIVKRNTKQLNTLLTNFLTSTNYSPVVLTKTNLLNIVDKALEQASDRIYLHGIKVNKKYPDNCFVMADEEKLKIAILNIIVNATEAMQTYEGILDISIENTQNSIVLCITDNGCGLEKEESEKLFDAFYTKKASGVGVGLNAVKNILEEHEALINVKSAPGEGTCFEISFDKA